MPGRHRLFNDKEKWCPRCKAWLPLGNFNDKPSSKSPCKKETYCRPCKKDYDELKNQNPDYIAKRNARMRWYRRLHDYGTTQDALQTMLEKQHGACAICGDPIAFIQHQCHIDHDHTTGKVRGLLCNRCNKGLGHLRDNIRILEAAIAYLRASCVPDASG